MKTQRKEHVRAIVFLLITVLLLSGLSLVLRVDTQLSKVAEQGVMQQEEGTLQAVYIGNSGVYRFWQSTLAWEEYGITVMNFASASMPGVATKYIMQEVQKKQSPGLFVVDLRSYTDSELDSANLHNIIDYFPMGLNRLKLVTRLCIYQKYWPHEALEFYFPVLRFHERWTELDSEDFRQVDDTLKGSYTYSYFLTDVQTEQTEMLTTTKRTEPQERAQKAFDELLDYCEKEDITVLFVAAPLLEHENQKERLNWFCDMAQSRGFSVLNFNDAELFDAVSLDVASDFMDNTHTNIYGSIKFTHWLGNYLVQNYGLDDRRSDPGYDSWDEAFTLYMQRIGEGPSSFYFEYTGQ